MPQGMKDRMEAMRAFPVEQMWVGLSFATDLADSQLVALRPIVSESWQQKMAVLGGAGKSQTWEDAAGKLRDLKKALDKKLKVILTKDQRKALEKLLKSQRRMSETPRRM